MRKTEGLGCYELLLMQNISIVEGWQHITFTAEKFMISNDTSR